ncbi:hypothetical protein ACOMHN_050880 [Nucella lapillus]
MLLHSSADHEVRLSKDDELARDHDLSHRQQCVAPPPAAAPISEIDSLISRTRGCITDLKDWMTTNKLQLNDDKTELMVVTKQPNHPSLPSTVTINDCTVTVYTSVRTQRPSRHPYTWGISGRVEVTNQLPSIER